MKSWLEDDPWASVGTDLLTDWITHQCSGGLPINLTWPSVWLNLKELRYAIAMPSEQEIARTKFMHELMGWGGVADRMNLGPQTAQVENSARQYCKRKGWVIFEGGYWRITDAGCEAWNWQRPQS
jgi:hypothetical protein